MLAVLFLCTYNSVRSQIAEGVCRMLHPDWELSSAGIAAGNISSYAVRCLEEAGCDCSSMYAKHLTELPNRQYDAVVVLCNNSWNAVPENEKPDLSSSQIARTMVFGRRTFRLPAAAGGTEGMDEG